MHFDKETTENLLITLSKSKFDGICRVIFSDYLNLNSLNVDRRGDGGGDWITVPYGGGKRAFLAQATIQDSNWKSKCIKDAEKAVNEFNCRKYIFLTSRRRDGVDLMDVENQIQDKFDIPASCLGAVEIADILISKKLLAKALKEAGLDYGLATNERPDRAEQLLFGVLSLSSGAAALRDGVTDDAILFTLSSNGPTVRETLISTVINTLQCGDHREGRINSRIDSLLSRQVLTKDATDNTLFLDGEALENLNLSKVAYQQQLSDLSEKIGGVLAEFGQTINDLNLIFEIAILSSRAMIVGTIQATQNAGVQIRSTLLLDQFGEPFTELKNRLKAEFRKLRDIKPLFEAVLNICQTHSLVRRLSHEILHFAIDGINPIHHAKALGVSSWEATEAAVDASVAIPLLCSKFTQPSTGRFSRSAIAGVAALQKAGSSLFIPRDYLNETAIHLLHAVDYCRPFEDPDILVSSPNGYVSHYYTLRRDQVPVPNTLIEFLLMLAPSLRNPRARDLVRQIMNDLEGKFSDLGLPKRDLGQIHPSYLLSINDTYARIMKNSQAARESILIEHDTRTLAWMKKCRATGDHGKLCLTWDELMISVAKEDGAAGWAVTPHQAADLITMGNQRDEAALLSVVHDLAAIRAAPDDFVGRLLDDVVGYARQGRLEWEVVSELSRLREEMHEKALNEGPPSDDEKRHIANDFWKKHGIDVHRPHERQNVTPEEIERALSAI